MTTEPNPQIGQAIAESLTEYEVEVVPFNNKEELRNAVANQSIDLALVENPEDDIPELYALAPVFESVLHVLVQASDTECTTQTLAQHLAGAQIYAGPRGGAGYRVLELLATTGILPPLNQLTLLETPFGPPPEAFLIFGGILSDDAVSRLDGFCLLSFDTHTALGNGSTVEGLALRHPQLEPFLIPRALYPPLSQTPTLTLSIKTLLVTHPQLDDDIAYTVIERVSESLSTLRRIYPLANLDPSNELTNGTVALKLHPASARYLARDTPGFIERYAEVLAFGLTLVVALVSASAALTSRRKRSRKDRLDTYFVTLAEIRRAWETEQVSHSAAQDQAQALQATVVQLLVDERIDADQALVSFLLVSNQLLSELRTEAD